MHILVSNDDGYRVPGVLALTRELAKYHQVTMVAPADEQSGVSHAFTMLKPLMSYRVDEELGLADVKAYAVTGTPVDCVKLGCFHLGDAMPDAILSGINRGPNLGTDVLYSGTVSAAMEGTLLGIPSIAVSSCGHNPTHYESAARYAVKALNYICSHPLHEDMILNVNVPDLPYDEIRGLKPAPLAIRHYVNEYVGRQDPRGRHYFWLSDSIKPVLNEDTDEAWIEKGYATVTPISINMTYRAYLDRMRSDAVFGGENGTLNED